MYAMEVISYMLYAASVFLTCSQQHVVDVLAVACLGTQQQQRSRSIPSRPNTLTLSCTVPCRSLLKLS